MELDCPNCQCRIRLTDGSLKRLAVVTSWVCLGGLAVAVVAGLLVPKVGPPATDPNWVQQTRAAFAGDDANAEKAVRQREKDNYEDWQKHMPPLERSVYELAGAVKAAAIVLICLLVPSAILAITIRPEPVQSRPPPRT